MSVDAVRVPVGRHHLLVGAGTFLVTDAVALAALAFRPIESTAAAALIGVALVVVAARIPAGGTRWVWTAGAAAGFLTVLAFYWASVWIHLEPAVVVGNG